MASSLYQRYRPQQFAEMIGQEHVRTTLMSEIAKGDVAHAFLLSGPRGVGKTTTARLIARAVNCSTPKTDSEPCGTCAECKSILEHKALDVMEIDAASHTGVDHVREQIIEHARTAPSRLKMKVFIIDEVHMLSTSAFNALLKTLEEPPKHALFILATTELHKVPATIISRCEHFRFARLTQEQIVERLRAMCTQEKRDVEDAVLRHIARLSDGAMRDAQSILGQVFAIDGGTITLDAVAQMLSIRELQVAVTLAQSLAERNLTEALQQVKEGVASGGQPMQIIVSTIAVLRAVLLSCVCGTVAYIEREVGDSDVAQKLHTAWSQHSIEDITTCVEHFMRAQEQQKTATLPELPLELACVHCVAEKAVVKESVTVASKQVVQKHVLAVAPKKVEPEKAIPVAAQKPAAPVAPTAQLAPIEPRVAPSAAPIEASECTLEFIAGRWPQVLESMRKRNQGLHVTLQVGKLVSVNARTIKLGFQYQFYHDRIMEARNRKLIDEALLEALGTQMHIEPVISDEFAMKETMDAAGNVEVVAEKELENIWDLAVHAFQPKHIEDIR